MSGTYYNIRSDVKIDLREVYNIICGHQREHRFFLYNRCVSTRKDRQNTVRKSLIMHSNINAVTVYCLYLYVYMR